MDNTLNKRLVALRERIAGKRGQRVFARHVGIKQQSISNYERGSIPSANVLAKIVLNTGVSAEWLLTGRGEMFPEGDAKRAGRDGNSQVSLIDDNDKEVDAERLAEVLEIAPMDAEGFLKSLTETPAGRNRLPMTLRLPSGRLMTLNAKVDSRRLREQVKVEITDTEVQVIVPEQLIKQRMIRLIPESQA